MSVEPPADPHSLAVIDTDVLLAATDRHRASHQAAVTLLEEDPRRLAITPQIAREYLSVATRPVEINGLGLEPKAALGNIRELLDEMEMLTEDLATTRRLLRLIDEHDVTGKQGHDANVVAVALVSRADSIVTDDERHFARFAELIAIEPLRRVVP